MQDLAHGLQVFQRGPRERLPTPFFGVGDRQGSCNNGHLTGSHACGRCQWEKREYLTGRRSPTGSTFFLSEVVDADQDLSGKGKCSIASGDDKEGVVVIHDRLDSSIINYHLYLYPSF